MIDNVDIYNFGLKLFQCSTKTLLLTYNSVMRPKYFKIGTRPNSGSRSELYTPFNFQVETLYSLFTCFIFSVLNIG